MFDFRNNGNAGDPEINSGWPLGPVAWEGFPVDVYSACYPSQDNSYTNAQGDKKHFSPPFKAYDLKRPQSPQAVGASQKLAGTWHLVVSGLLFAIRPISLPDSLSVLAAPLTPGVVLDVAGAERSMKLVSEYPAFPHRYFSSVLTDHFRLTPCGVSDPTLSQSGFFPPDSRRERS